MEREPISIPGAIIAAILLVGLPYWTFSIGKEAFHELKKIEERVAWAVAVCQGHVKSLSLDGTPRAECTDGSEVHK